MAGGAWEKEAEALGFPGWEPITVAAYLAHLNPSPSLQPLPRPLQFPWGALSAPHRPVSWPLLLLFP